MVRYEEGYILSGRDRDFVYVGSRFGIRFYNAVLGMRSGIFIMYSVIILWLRQVLKYSMAVS